jgi:hypothetical protein
MKYFRIIVALLWGVLQGTRGHALAPGSRVEEMPAPKARMRPLFIKDRLNPKGMILVHARRGFPYDGTLKPNCHYGKGPLLMRNPRVIVEFSWNGTIDIFDGSPVVVLIPFENVDPKSIVNLHYVATSHFGALEIPAGSWILVREHKMPDRDVIESLALKNIEVRPFPRHRRASLAVTQFLPGIGYRPMELVHDQWGRTTTFRRTDTFEDFGEYFEGNSLARMTRELATRLGIESCRKTDEYALGWLTWNLEQMQYNFVHDKIIPHARYEEFREDSLEYIKGMPESLKTGIYGRILIATIELYTAIEKVTAIYYESLMPELSSQLEFPYARDGVNYPRDEIPGMIHREKRTFLRQLRELYGFRYPLRKGNDTHEFYNRVKKRLAVHLVDRLSEQYALLNHPAFKRKTRKTLLAA